MIGEVISNYKILSVIGEGGMGVVYLAEHIHLSRKAAIKALHQKLISNNHIRERFRNEAATLSQIEHPNIVKLYDYVEKDNGLYLIMEYVDGVPLDEYIVKESGPISEGPAIKIMSGMLAAFSYAHKKNIVHRDVKPSNVIISRDFGVVKILDFGIAKILGDDSRNLTKDGTQMGTIYYMSPEQVRGAKLDKRSDIYSLGVTFLQIVTGINPYESLTTEFDIYTQITQTDLPEAKSIYPYVSDKIGYVIKKAAQKNVEDRYQNCDQMLKELNDDQLEIPVINTAPQEESYPAPSRNVENIKSGKKLLIGSGIGAILIIISILIYFFGGLKEYFYDDKEHQIQVKDTASYPPAKSGLDGIIIGTQSWSTKNLDVSYFRNGDPISEAQSDAEWVSAIKGMQPAWCYYNNDPTNGTKYGKLYNWYAVNDPRGLAPQGWHVPSDAEWSTLSAWLGGDAVAGDKMKEAGTANWKNSNTGADNSSGFAGLPGGNRSSYGSFGNIASYGYWWSASDDNTSAAWFRNLSCNDGSIVRRGPTKVYGFSVRCLRD